MAENRVLPLGFIDTLIVNGGGKVGRVGGRLLSIGDQILYRLPSFIGL